MKLHGAELIRQPDRIRIDEDGAVQTIRSWRGTRAACIEFQRTLIGVPSEIFPRGASAELQAVFAGDEDTPDAVAENWTLRRVELRRDLAVHPDYASLSAGVIATIDRVIQDGTAAEQVENLTGATQKLLKYRLRGMDAYKIYYPVIVQTLSAVKEGQLRAQPPNSTIPAIVQASAIPAPAGIMYRIPSGWEWMVVPETVNTTGRPGIYRIERSWIGAEKWADLYPGGTYTP